MPKPPLTISQIAGKYGVHRDTVHGWINDGVQVPGPCGSPDGRLRLVAQRVGGRFLIRRGDLRRFIAACNAGRGDPAVRQKRQTSMEQRAAKAAAEFREIAKQLR